VRKDGRVLDVSVSISPVRDAADRVTGYATVARDVTDQTRAAAQIRAYQEQVSRTERMETVGQLAAGIAHDFNNTLGAIAGVADLIKGGEVPSDASDNAQHILAAGARLEGARPGHYAELTVTDTGTGMTPEVAARIFETFYTTKGPSLGSGLGLSTVYGVIAQASGTITVTLQPGVGTTFRILFPAAATVPGQASAPSPEATEPLPTDTILITDDEQPIFRATARILKRDGYTPWKRPPATRPSTSSSPTTSSSS
jgi:signal transduction histidine kinase